MISRIVMGAAAALMISTAANAADVYHRGEESFKDAPSSHYSWSGFYAGLHAGYAWGEYGEDAQGFFDNAEGFVGGGQIGYNIQRGNFVFGIEGDISGSDFGDSNFGVDFETNLLASVRGRVGIAHDRTLFYVTGGVAFADVQVDLPFGFGSDDETLTGFTVGGGIERAVRDNITVKLEYLYTEYDSEEFFRDLGGADFDLETHAVRVGVNFKLGGHHDEPLK